MKGPTLTHQKQVNHGDQQLVCMCFFIPFCKCCLSDKGWDEGESLRDSVSDDPKAVATKDVSILKCVTWRIGEPGRG